MLQSDSVKISKVLVKLISELGRTSLGKSFLFNKYKDKIITCKRDEKSKSIFFQLVMDNYSFSFPEKNIAFKDISTFFRLCELQGLVVDPSFIMDRLVQNSIDGINIANSHSELFYKLSNPESTTFDADDGYGMYESCENSDPTVFTFDLTKEEITNIFSITQEIEPTRFNFKKVGHDTYIHFKGNYTYSRKISTNIVDPKFVIDEDISFKYAVFEYMKKCDQGFSFEYLYSEDNNNLRMKSQIAIENEVINIMFESPSRTGD